MKFKDALSKVKKLLTVKGKVRQYFLYAAIILAILSLVNGFLTSRANTQLAKEKADLEQLNKDRATSNAELNAQLADLHFASEITMQEIEGYRLSEVAAKDEIDRMELEITESKAESNALEAQLEEAHENLAGTGLKNTFLGDQITNELRNHFPSSEHVFFSSTQEDLFRVNPETANLIYTVITENAVRVQLIEQLNTSIEATGYQLEAAEFLVDLRGDEIDAYVNLVAEFNETFDNLEAALSLERRTVSNLERQIAIMNRKNLFQKVLPSLNVVIGPYYDPFRNQGGFAVALGLGWRF